MDATERDKLYRLLRSQRPAKLVAVTLEGDEQELALKRGKGRWDGACDAIASMCHDLECVRLLNDGGALIRVWEPPGEREAPAPAARVAPAPRVDLAGEQVVPFSMVREVVGLIVEQSAAAVQRHTSALGETHAKLLETLQLQAEANRTLMAQQQAALKMTFDATIARAEAHAALLTAGQDSGVDAMNAEMMQLVMARAMGMDPAAIVQAMAAKAMAAAQGGGEGEQH